MPWLDLVDRNANHTHMLKPPARVQGEAAKALFVAGQVQAQDGQPLQALPYLLAAQQHAAQLEHRPLVRIWLGIRPRPVSACLGDQVELWHCCTPLLAVLCSE